MAAGGHEVPAAADPDAAAGPAGAARVRLLPVRLAAVGHQRRPVRHRRAGLVRAGCSPTTPDDDWPDGLLLLGDQVYADETSPITQDVIRRRRDVSKPPGLQVANFAEYAELYDESWGDPLVRWLYATVPTAMIFDDHDIHDDWNTSGVWRERMQQT